MPVRCVSLHNEIGSGVPLVGKRHIICVNETRADAGNIFVTIAPIVHDNENAKASRLVRDYLDPKFADRAEQFHGRCALIRIVNEPNGNGRILIARDQLDVPPGISEIERFARHGCSPLQSAMRRAICCSNGWRSGFPLSLTAI
jgi:hypothetical protein